MQAQPSELHFLWASDLKVQIASSSIRRKKCTYSHVIRINNINVEMRFQIHALCRHRGLGAEGSPIFSDSILYLLKTIVDLYCWVLSV